MLPRFKPVALDVKGKPIGVGYISDKKGHTYQENQKNCPPKITEVDDSAFKLKTETIITSSEESKQQAQSVPEQAVEEVQPDIDEDFEDEVENEFNSETAIDIPPQAGTEDEFNSETAIDIPSQTEKNTQSVNMQHHKPFGKRKGRKSKR